MPQHMNLVFNLDQLENRWTYLPTCLELPNPSNENKLWYNLPQKKPSPAFPPTPQEWSEMITFWGYDTVTRNNDIVVKRTIDMRGPPKRSLGGTLTNFSKFTQKAEKSVGNFSLECRFWKFCKGSPLEFFILFLTSENTDFFSKYRPNTDQIWDILWKSLYYRPELFLQT